MTQSTSSCSSILSMVTVLTSFTLFHSVHSYNLDDIQNSRPMCEGKPDGAYESVNYTSAQFYPGGPIRNYLGHFCCSGNVFDIQCADLCACSNTGMACYGAKSNCNDAYVTVDIDHEFLTCTASYPQMNGSDIVVNKVVEAADYCAQHWQRLIPKQISNKPSDALEQALGKFELIKNPETNYSSTGVIGIHAVLLPHTSSILYWDRIATPDTALQPGGYQTASSVFDTDTGIAKRTPIKEAPFCSGQTHLLDGRVLVMGGEADDMPWTNDWSISWEKSNRLEDGLKSIRTFDYKTLEWTTLDTQLPAKHWYPTHCVVSDGRVVNVGGWEGVGGTKVMDVEVFDPAINQLIKNHTSISFTEVIDIVNLYPAVLLLPYTDSSNPDDEYLLMYSCIYGELVKLTPDNNFETVFVMPDLPPQAKTFCSSFSALGTSQLLALRHEDNYTAEFMMMGGTSTPRSTVSFNTTNRKLTTTGVSAEENVCACNFPGSMLSARIRLNIVEKKTDATPEGPQIEITTDWEIENMPIQRVAGQMVVLPNGKVIIFNGGQNGFGNDYQKDPVYTPVLYDPYAKAGNRYSVLAASSISRLYHSTAVLVPDGTVVISGQDQGECTGNTFCGTNYAYHYEAEKFTPPFIASGIIRPKIKNVITANSSNATQHMGNSVNNLAILGETFDIEYSYDGNLGDITHVSIVRPAAVTHSIDMSSRVVFVPIVARGQGERSQLLTVKLPEAKTRAIIGGAHMVFIMAGDVYSTGKWIHIAAK